MSNPVLDGKKEEVKVDDVNVQEEKVDKKAYESVSKDMHKYKALLKEKEDLLNKLNAEKEDFLKQEAIKNEQWKQLYESTEQKMKRLEQERNEEKSKFINYHKKQAVVQKLGGFKRDEYTSFVNVDAVEVDENGNIVEESLINEVNRIKQNYIDLLKSSKVEELPKEAPKSPATFKNEDLSKMSERERTAYKLSLLKKK